MSGRCVAGARETVFTLEATPVKFGPGATADAPAAGAAAAAPRDPDHIGDRLGGHYGRGCSTSPSCA